MITKNKTVDYFKIPESLEGELTKSEEYSLGLYMALERAYHTFSRELSKRIRESNLTPPQFGILETLYHLGPTTLSSLGEKLLVTAGNITCVVDKLESMGLVKRERYTNDRRIIIADLTENGRDTISSLFPLYVKRMDELASELTEKEKISLQKLLCRLSKSIED